MGYIWTTLNSGFSLSDHTTPIYGIRLRQIGTWSDYCGYLSEKQGYDCNEKAYDGGKTEAEGYYTWHRFNTNSSPDFFDRQLSGQTNIWSTLPTETIEGVEWKTHDFHTPPLYWGGFLKPNLWNNYYGYIQLKIKQPFEPSKSVFKFSSVGGTDTFTLEADSNWTATTSSNWVSLNSMTGTTGGTLTLTCNRNYTETARTATITFTNAGGDTFDIVVNQKRGTTEKSVNKMYKNGSLIFQRQLFNTKLTIGDNSLSFQKTGGTKDVAVKSNVPYTCSSNVDWLTISSGASGISVTAIEHTGTTERTGTITITANNAGDIVTKTISVVQKVIGYVSYIHTATLSDNQASFIDTGIYPTTATTMRIIGQGKGYEEGGKVVGFSENDAGSDRRDYRLIWYTEGGSRLRWDFNSSELPKTDWGGAYNGRLIDFTCGNNYVYDNISQQNYVTGTTQSSMATTNVPIYVGVGTWWVKQLQIWQGEELVFDGEAAVIDGNVGLYDRVSETLKYNPDLTMGYEQ